MERKYLHPFDLQAPTRLLVSHYSPIREDVSVKTLKLGYDDSFTVKKFSYQDGRVTFQIVVPCSTERHCNTCDCDDTHYASLSEEQVAALREMLGGR